MTTARVVVFFLLCGIAAGAVGCLATSSTETNNPLSFLLIAEERTRSEVRRFEDLGGSFYCDELPTILTCPTPTTEGTGSGGTISGNGGGGTITGGGGDAGTSAPVDGCACLGFYHLKSTSGLELILTRDALVEGTSPSTGNGKLKTLYHGRPGTGFVVFSRAHKIQIATYYFVDVAGGFELTFPDAKFVKGAFYSMDRDSAKDGT